MASVVIGQLICTMALVVLIIILPVFYTNIQDNLKVNVIKLELQEIADYVSSTYANTYYLVNSTDFHSPSQNVTKDLVYLPSTVQNQIFTIKVEGNSSAATGITVFIRDRPSVSATAWLGPGLRGANIPSIDSGGPGVFVGCSRDPPSHPSGVYVILGRESGI